ncbi:Asp/Glu/hydantoin racemase [Xylariaceae sp. FL0804]|nr:Asp/Glu/hydantoin racemase [Xylariaceae sp. FL0804]
MASAAVQAPISYVSPRARFGLIVPATNTVVEAEFSWMLVPGVSFHSGRIEIANPSLKDDATMVAFLESLRVTIGDAVARVCSCLPTYMVMGMSAETFWGGRDGAAQFERFMTERSGGLGVTTGALAARAALDRYGARRIGIITPYQAVGDQQVVDFFAAEGYAVHRIHGLRCDSATSIAEVGPETLKDAFRAVDAPEVDALLQAGTNLPCARVAAEMEIELGKPRPNHKVIAINTATLWHAYRTNGIMDKVQGFGSLLEKH